MTDSVSHAKVAKKYLANEPLAPQEKSLWTAHSDEAGRRYYSLQYAVSRGTMLAEVPRLFVVVVKRKDWSRGWTWAGHHYDAPSLGEYVTRKPPRGLGATLEMAKSWVHKDPEALAMFTAETTGISGAHLPNDNIIRSQQGTSRAYTVRRLKEQRPDLFEQVRAGKFSVNRAAEKAGWRKKPTPLEQIRKLVTKLTADERTELRQWLDETTAASHR